MQRKSIRNLKAFVDTGIKVTSYEEVKKLKKKSAISEVKDNNSRKSTLNFKVCNPPLIKAITMKNCEDGAVSFATRESNDDICNIDTKNSNRIIIASERNKGVESNPPLNTIIEENFPVQNESVLAHHFANPSNGSDMYPKFELNLKPIIAVQTGKIISNEPKLSLKENRTSIIKVQKKSSIPPEKKSVGFVNHDILDAEAMSITKDVHRLLHKNHEESNNPTTQNINLASKASELKLSSKHRLQDFQETTSYTNRGHEPAADNEKIQKALNFEENSEVFAFKKLMQLDAVSKVGLKNSTAENLLVPPEDQKDLIQKKIEYEIKSFTDLRLYLLENNIKPARLLDSIINNLTQNSMYDNIKDFYARDVNNFHSKNNSFVSENSVNKIIGEGKDNKDDLVNMPEIPLKRRTLGKKKTGFLCLSCF